MTAENRRYRTAYEELDEALMHSAPNLTRLLVEQIGNQAAVELASVIRRAVHKANRQHDDAVAQALQNASAEYARVFAERYGLVDELETERPEFAGGPA